MNFRALELRQMVATLVAAVVAVSVAPRRGRLGDHRPAGRVRGRHRASLASAAARAALPRASLRNMRLRRQRALAAGCFLRQPKQRQHPRGRYLGPLPRVLARLRLMLIPLRGSRRRSGGALSRARADPKIAVVAKVWLKTNRPWRRSSCR
jgi:hypothetical protein